MIALRIITYAAFALTIIIQMFHIRFLQRQNRELRQQLNAQSEQTVKQLMRAYRVGTYFGQSFPVPPRTWTQRDPPEPDPLGPPPPVSKSTRQMIAKIQTDPNAPEDWGVADPRHARIGKPSDHPQPRSRAECIHCGRPILWLGWQAMRPGDEPIGEWRDHAGKAACDGFIDGVKGRHKPKNTT